MAKLHSTERKGLHENRKLRHRSMNNSPTNCCQVVHFIVHNNLLQSASDIQTDIFVLETIQFAIVDYRSNRVVVERSKEPICGDLFTNPIPSHSIQSETKRETIGQIKKFHLSVNAECFSMNSRAVQYPAQNTQYIAIITLVGTICIIFHGIVIRKEIKAENII